MPTKRYWLRGGIIGLIIPFLGLAFLVVFYRSDFGLDSALLTFSVIFGLPNLLLWLTLLVGHLGLNPFFGQCPDYGLDAIPCVVVATLILAPIWYFLGGSFIGWLYGKFKNRKNVVM